MKSIRYVIVFLLFLLTSTSHVSAQYDVKLKWDIVQSDIKLSDISFSKLGDGYGVGDQGRAAALSYTNNKYVLSDQTIAGSNVLNDYVASDMVSVSMIGNNAYIFGDYFPYGVMERQIFNGRPMGYGINLPTPDPIKNKQYVYNDSFSFDSNNGYVIAVGKNGLITKLTPNGSTPAFSLIQRKDNTNWTEQHLNAVHVLDQNVIWVAGNQGAILKTSNAGTSWSLVNVGMKSDFVSVWFSDLKTGWLGGNDGIILKTIDGGKTWANVDLGVSGNISNIHFLDSDNGFVTVDKAGIFYTNDGGNHWSQVYGSQTGQYQSIVRNTLGEIWVLQDYETFVINKQFLTEGLMVSGYKDIYETTPAYDAITKLTKQGILTGINGYFYPYKEYTRAEAATVLSKMLSLNSTSGSNFTDVKPTDWYYPFVQKMSGLGLLKGFEDGSFRPNETITLEQICKIIHDADVLLFKDASIQNLDTFIQHYPYSSAVSDWALESMAYCFNQGYFDQLDMENIKPNSGLKRREAAQLFFNFGGL